jgi:UDP-N-acetylglucosamine 1-carboxyvinyltransferase
MDRFVINGGRKLSGSITISGSKNTALPLMSAGLLTDEPVLISNIPNLKDIATFSRVMAVTGTSVEHDIASATVRIDAGSLDKTEAPYELVKRMRASFYMLGALIGREGKARVSLPGGCAWGPRPVGLHIDGLKAFGATIDLDEGYVVGSTPGGRLPGGIFRMEPSSVGATVNLLLAAVTASGGSRIENAAVEPDVVVFSEMLQKMGAVIHGIGTSTLEIEGVSKLSGGNFANCPDRIELGTFMIAAAIAGDPAEEIAMTNAEPKHLGSAFLDRFRETGPEIRIDGTTVYVRAPEALTPVSVTTEIYPGFPTDLQAQWTVLLACCDGNGKVRETIYPDRFKHIPELHRMGINAIVVGDEVVVEGGGRGGDTFQGTQVMSTDLRASVSLVLAGMVASGTTYVQRVYHLDRGYENLEGKLAALGADVVRERYDEWADPV